jgi:8-hydroxy-5-deazaflavin:NADPH oxidoreductase
LSDIEDLDDSKAQESQSLLGSENMKIGIIGSGNVGSALGEIWCKSGHAVMFSSRHPEKLTAWAESLGSNASNGLPSQASKFGDVVVLAVPWGQVESALQSIVPLDGKILIDCTNPLKPDYSGLVIGNTTSAGEEVARMATGARVVKAFNTTFAVVMKSESRMFGGLKPTGFFCGDDSSAKLLVSDLIKETGLEPVDVGPLSCARFLEPVNMLMIQLGFGQKMGMDMALRLLRR